MSPPRSTAFTDASPQAAVVVFSAFSNVLQPFFSFPCLRLRSICSCRAAPMNLKYPTRFVADRDVKLVGEAYFKVTHDGRTRFRVHTPSMQVEVMGTEFNVDAYDNPQRTVRTTLVNGSVNLLYSDNDGCNHVIEMMPGQCASFDKSLKSITVGMADIKSIVSWREGKIVLNRTSLADAFRMIENHFNVEFVVSNPMLYKHNFTGVFADQSLETILDHFRYSSHMHFRRTVPHDRTLMSGREIIEVY